MDLLLGSIHLEGIVDIHAGRCAGSEEEEVRIWGRHRLQVGREPVYARLRIYISPIQKAGRDYRPPLRHL